MREMAYQCLHCAAYIISANTKGEEPQFGAMGRYLFDKMGEDSQIQWKGQSLKLRREMQLEVKTFWQSMVLIYNYRTL